MQFGGGARDSLTAGGTNIFGAVVKGKQGFYHDEELNSSGVARNRGDKI
jgi:hypothetical protein